MAGSTLLHKATKSVLRVALVFAFAAAVAALILQGQTNSSINEQATKPGQGPVADYNGSLPLDPEKRAQRQIRNKKYDRAHWSINPADVSDSTVSVDYLDTNLPALPVVQSDAIVVGEILDENTYLSDDKTGVYSEFSVRVEQILKNDSFVTLMPTCCIDIEREGGHVRLPSGKIHSYSIDKANMPQVGKHYVLFLKGKDKDQAYHVVTAYELRGDKVFPLDELPQFNAHKGVDKEAFLTKLSSILAPLP